MSAQQPSDQPVSPKRTRRDFLQTTGTVAAVAAFAPHVVASDKAGTKPAIVGEGDHRYECVHGWGELPKQIRWGATHGVTIDEEGLIYIKHQSYAKEPVMDAIVVFDRDGKYVRSFGKEYHGGGHGIDIRKEDGQEFLYLSDVKNRRVAKTDLKGEIVWTKDYPREPDVYENENQYRPTNIAFAPGVVFYIGDGYGSSYIHQYDKDAKWIRTWGGVCEEPCKMKTPHGLWLDARPGRTPSLVVADRANARLQYFTLDGNHIGFVDTVSFPADIDIQGDIMLVPDLHARVTLYDRDNNVITHLGYSPEWTEKALANKFEMRSTPSMWVDGRFVHPHDACFDHDGNIFVTEWVATGRVSFLRRV